MFLTTGMGTGRDGRTMVAEEERGRGGHGEGDRVLFEEVAELSVI